MSFWTKMDLAPRLSATAVTHAVVPTDSGVYAWYLAGRRVYVGKAKSLCSRICNNHRGNSITSSAFQRNVAESLGIASSADIKTRRRVLTAPEKARVRNWIDGCEIAWQICASDAEAKHLESKLKAEFLPPLTKL